MKAFFFIFIFSAVANGRTLCQTSFNRELADFFSAIPFDSSYDIVKKYALINHFSVIEDNSMFPAMSVLVHSKKIPEEFQNELKSLSIHINYSDSLYIGNETYFKGFEIRNRSKYIRPDSVEWKFKKLINRFKKITDHTDTVSIQAMNGTIGEMIRFYKDKMSKMPAVTITYFVHTIAGFCIEIRYLRPDN